MEYLRIVGGRPLSGIARVGGAKNAALPIMAAAILAEEPVELAAVPQLQDVETLRLVLGQLGVRSQWLAEGRLRLETVDLTRSRAEYPLVRRMRASFCVLGPLLGRRGQAVVSLPGGCNLGPRPVDVHLRGLEALGAELTIAHGYVIARARCLRGARISVAGPHGTSVTGTANLLCAATRAEGRTIIMHAAREPEIVDLGQFLQMLGAEIEGLGTDTLVIHGRPQLGGGTHQIIPDRIEAGTLLLAVAIAGGQARVEGLEPAHLASTLELLERVGMALRVESHAVEIASCGTARATDLRATPFPGIPTDLQAQWLALLCLAEGTSRVADTVFPQRFMHVAELVRMGACIEQQPGMAIVCGVPQLSGAAVQASDLRAAAALVLAGLAARGVTTVTGLAHLDRGYSRLDGKLRGLGADVERLGGAPQTCLEPATV